MWQPIETAPKDGATFFAVQDGEVYVASFHDGRLMFRTHDLREPRTYQIVKVEMDGKEVEASVLIEEGPDVFEHHWCYWTRGFDFNPTHWMPLPSPPSTDNKE